MKLYRTGISNPLKRLDGGSEMTRYTHHLHVTDGHLTAGIESAIPICMNANNDKSFAALVLETARAVPAAGRFGSDKVFISAVWERYGFGMTLERFKEWVGYSNSTGALRLCRADLVELMDPATVKASETKWENAEFHFVRV